jgi:hypothetical protein
MHVRFTTRSPRIGPTFANSRLHARVDLGSPLTGQLASVPIAFTLHSYPADDLVVVRLQGAVDADQLRAALLGVPRGQRRAQTRWVWDAVGLGVLDLPPDAFEQILRAGQRIARGGYAPQHVVAATDLIPRAIALLFGRRAQSAGISVSIVSSVEEALRTLGIDPESIGEDGASRAA